MSVEETQWAELETVGWLPIATVEVPLLRISVAMTPFDLCPLKFSLVEKKKNKTKVLRRRRE